MKYKDYYQTLGVPRTATIDQIKKAYRKLAHQYHPDVSKDPKGEEKFKEAAEAYATLKSPEKRAEYDKLGSRSEGEQFTAPPEWQQQYGAGASSFDDVDLSDILNAFRSGTNGAGHASSRFSQRGEDYEIPVAVTLEKIYVGGDIDVTVELPDYDEHGLPHRVPHTFRITVPKDATDGQRMRLAGKGGPGSNGGKPGDLYVILKLTPHPLYRIKGADLYLDLKLSPWEAVLGATVKLTTPGGEVELKIKPATTAGQHLRLTGRGLQRTKGSPGDLYAVVQIVVPAKISPAQQELYVQLAALSDFNPRSNQ